MTPSELSPAEGGSVSVTKQRMLNYVKSLDPADDARTSLSKKISWILRQGAKSRKSRPMQAQAQSIGVDITDDGWVKLDDLASAVLLDEYYKEEIFDNINESNVQKNRYQLKTVAEVTMVRAIPKSERPMRNSRVSLLPGSKLRADAPEFVSQPALAKEALATPCLVSMGSPHLASLAGSGLGGGPPGVSFLRGEYLRSMWAQQAMRDQAAQMAAMQQAMLLKKRYRGSVKSYNHHKGFGFIECQETFLLFGRDIFLHKLAFSNLRVGDIVTFALHRNKDGLPQADQVQLENRSPGSGGKAGGPKGNTKERRGGKARSKEN